MVDSIRINATEETVTTSTSIIDTLCTVHQQKDRGGDCILVHYLINKAHIYIGEWYQHLSCAVRMTVGTVVLELRYAYRKYALFIDGP